MTHLVPLPWAKPPLSLNDRDHWRVKARKVALARDQARWAIRAARIPAFETVHLTLHWRVPDRRRRDLDNLAATLKPVTDALVDEKCIPDDDWRHVLAATTQIHAPDPRARQGVWLELHNWTLAADEVSTP